MNRAPLAKINVPLRISCRDGQASAKKGFESDDREGIARLGESEDACTPPRLEAYPGKVHPTTRKRCLQIKRRMTSVEVWSKSGDVETVTQKSFPSWKRRAGKNLGFVVKTADSETLVLTRGDMRRLPEGVFEAELVKKYAIEDPLLKKQLRGSDEWKVC